MFYSLENFWNKIIVGKEMLFAGYAILIDELTRFILNKEEMAFMPRLRKLPAELLFKVGLVVTGVKWFERYEFKTSKVMEAQHRILMKIIHEGEPTIFGKDHQFKQIKSVQDFQRNVQVQTYDSLKPYIDRHIHGDKSILVPGKPISYATTSGTTGEPKYIPITEDSKEYSHKAVSRMWVYRLYKDRPQTFDGKILAITSLAEEGKTPDGTIYGSTSGQMLQGMNKVIKQKYALPYDVFKIDDYDARYYTILRIAIEQNITYMMTANPSTLSLLAKKGNEWKELLIEDVRNGTLNQSFNLPPNLRFQFEKQFVADPKKADFLARAIANDPENKLRPKAYWPNLASIGCWTGGNSGTFIEAMNAWYGDPLIRDIGYLASEIRGSVPLWSDTNAGVLTVNQNFFEFVHMDDIDSAQPRYLTCDEVKRGERYYIFITTRAGLYRYNINDIVEIKGFYQDTPIITFIQKGKGVTNITGEKLYEEQLMSAIDQASKSTNLPVKFYMALAKVSRNLYELYVEFKDHSAKADYADFLSQVETALQTINIEYQAKRKSLRLNAMELHVLSEGAFEGFKKMRIDEGIREAQFKTVPLTQDETLTRAFDVQQVITLLKV